jgi:cytochrome P450
MNPAVIDYDKDVFGSDLDVFRPERWLNKEQAPAMEKAMITFGAGTRTCIGKDVSYGPLVYISSF